MQQARLAEANIQPYNRDPGFHTSIDKRVLPTAELAATTAQACSDSADSAAARRAIYPP
jgi:hypothetical protein